MVPFAAWCHRLMKQGFVTFSALKLTVFSLISPYSTRPQFEFEEWMWPIMKQASILVRYNFCILLLLQFELQYNFENVL